MPPPDLTRVFSGQYTATGLLGRGSFGEVWRVVDSHGQAWALKLIAVPDEDKLRLRELTEVGLLHGLRHRHLLHPVASAGTPDGKLAIVMELADGGTLADRLEQATARGELLAPRALLEWLEEAAKALDYLHDHDVVHRDVKPANLLIAGGRVKVADFGLARAQEASLATQSKMAGSPAYMAPEVWRQKGGPASDQYSLALTYAHLRQGFPAVHGDSWVDWIQAHQTGRCELSATVTPAERRVLKRALSADPSDRFPNCTVFAAALRAAAGEADAAPARAAEAPPTPTGPPPSIDGWKTGGGSAAASKWRRQPPTPAGAGWRVPAAVAGGVLVALGGLSAAVVALTPPPPCPTDVASHYSLIDGIPPTLPEREPVVQPATQPAAQRPSEPEPTAPILPPMPEPPDPIATGDAPPRAEVKPPADGVVVTADKGPATAVDEGDAPPPLGVKDSGPNGAGNGREKTGPTEWDLHLLARLELDDQKAGVIGTLKNVCGPHADAVLGATFVGDGRGLVCVTRGINADDLKNPPPGVKAAVTPATIQLWDVAAGKRVHTARFSLDRCWSAAVSRDGRRGYIGGEKGQIVVFDFDTWAQVTTLKGGSGGVLTLALSADGKTLVSSGHGGTLRVWDTTRLELDSEFTPMPGTCAKQFDLSANGREVVAVHTPCGNANLPPEKQSEALRVWDWKARRQVDGWGAGHLYQHARSLPDGRVAQSTWKGSVAIWTGRGEKAKAEYLTGHAEGELVFAVAPDGKHLLAHGGDGKARWWDLNDLTAKPQVFDTKLKGGTVSIDPAGKLAAVADGGTIVVLKLPAR